MKRPIRTWAAVSALALAATACGGAAAAVTTTEPAATGATTSTTIAATTTKVSANAASIEEIAAAIAAVGVGDAQRWAREVAEYRPYDTADPTLAHLRDELEKYNPGQGVIDAIISVLEP